MKTIQYNNGKCKCDCGGMLACSGTMKQKLPMGFGFAHNGKFVIDSIVRKGYAMECMDCDKKYFAVKGKSKLVSSYPKSINKKINDLR